MIWSLRLYLTLTLTLSCLLFALFALFKCGPNKLMTAQSSPTKLARFNPAWQAVALFKGSFLLICRMPCSA